jgi:protein phosphatase
MGQDIDFEVDIGEQILSPGDQVVICSDGITNMVELDEINEMMFQLEPKGFVHALIDAANQNGGVDNSTAVTFRVS